MHKKDLMAIVGDKPIKDLYSFLLDKCEQEKDKGDTVQMFKSTRTLAEVGLAMYDYAEHLKEKGNAKNKRT